MHIQTFLKYLNTKLTSEAQYEVKRLLGDELFNNTLVQIIYRTRKYKRQRVEQFEFIFEYSMVLVSITERKEVVGITNLCKISPL